MTQEWLAAWSGAKKWSNREGYSSTAMFFEHWTSEAPANATINQTNYSQITKPTATLDYPDQELLISCCGAFESKLNKPDKFRYDGTEFLLGPFKVTVHPTDLYISKCLVIHSEMLSSTWYVMSVFMDIYPYR